MLIGGIFIPFYQLQTLSVQISTFYHQPGYDAQYYQWDAQGNCHSLTPIYFDDAYLGELEGINSGYDWLSPETEYFRIGYSYVLDGEVDSPYIKISSSPNTGFVVFLDDGLLYSDFPGEEASLGAPPVGREGIPLLYTGESFREIATTIPTDFSGRRLTVIEYVPQQELELWSLAAPSVENGETTPTMYLMAEGSELLITGMLAVVLVILAVSLFNNIWTGKKPWLLLPICFLMGYMLYRSNLPMQHTSGIWDDISSVVSWMYIYCLGDLLLCFTAAKLKGRLRYALAIISALHFALTTGVIIHHHLTQDFMSVDYEILHWMGFLPQLLAIALILVERKSNDYFKHSGLYMLLMACGYGAALLISRLTGQAIYYDLLAPLSAMTSLSFVGITGLLSMALLLLIAVLSTSATISELISSRVRLKTLERINAFKTEFFGNISHELKTPITVLVNHAYNAQTRLQAIPESEDTKALGENLRYLASSADKLSLLTQQLLSAAALDEGRLTLVLQPCNLGEIIRSVARGHFATLNEGGNELVIKSDPELPDIQADPQKLEQVFVNLMTNALRHTKNGVITITVAASSPVAGVEVTVSDNGEGIPPERLPYIFDRYNRPPEDISGKTGTGLGLYICKEIIQLHGGEITVESSPGEGASFHFTLPSGLE